MKLFKPDSKQEYDEVLEKYIQSMKAQKACSHMAFLDLNIDQLKRRILALQSSLILCGDQDTDSQRPLACYYKSVQ